MVGTVVQTASEHAVSLLVGIAIGVWVGGRFLVIRKRSDDRGRE